VRRAGRGALAVFAAIVLAAGSIASADAVNFRTPDGAVLNGTLFDPGQHPAPGVVLVHMLTRTRADWLPLAERLQRSGLVVLTFDMRGHGESGGSFDSADLQPLRADVQAAVHYLKGRREVSPARIALVGASVGANLAALVAAADPAVQALVLLSPGLEYRGVRIEAALRQYGERPALLVAATNDPYALRSARQLGEGVAGRELLTPEGGGHGTIMLARQPELITQVVDWLRTRLL
jgi:dienelactone hydrolase